MPKEPTLYEQQLMESLGFQTLEELTEFLNLPVVDDLKMKPPELIGDWDEEQTQKAKSQRT